MTVAPAFQTQLSSLAVELNERHKSLDHAFSPYLAPRILFSDDFYGADERRLLANRHSFAVNEKSFAFPEEILREFDQHARRIANSFCAKLVIAPVEFRNGPTLSPAGDGVGLIDATGGLLVEHISSALEDFEHFNENSAFIVTSTERERLESLSELEQNPAICLKHGIATHVLGSKIITLPSDYLPAEWGERSCIVLTSGALYFQLTWTADDGYLVANLSGVRADGELVHMIRTTAC